MLHNFLISSDPYLSHIRPKLSKNKHQEFHPDTVDLLLERPLLSEDYEESEVVSLQGDDSIGDPLCL